MVSAGVFGAVGAVVAQALSRARAGRAVAIFIVVFIAFSRNIKIIVYSVLTTH
jgi:hypothetical protein